MEYTATDYMPNSDAERALIYGNSGILGQYGTDYYRFSDGRNYFVYRLTGEIGQMAYVVMDISVEYLVEVSTDNKNWTEVLNYSRDGLFREKRGIDLTSYFEFSTNVYLKISDAVPENGWGGQVQPAICDHYRPGRRASGLSGYLRGVEGHHRNHGQCRRGGYSLGGQRGHL